METLQTIQQPQQTFPQVQQTTPQQQQKVSQQQTEQKQQPTQNKELDRQLELRKGRKNNNCNKDREGTNNAIPIVMTERSRDKRQIQEQRPRAERPGLRVHAATALKWPNHPRAKRMIRVLEIVLEYSGDSWGEMECYPTPSSVIKTTSKESEKQRKPSNRRLPKRDNLQGRMDSCEY